MVIVHGGYITQIQLHLRNVCVCRVPQVQGAGRAVVLRYFKRPATPQMWYL